MPELQAPFTWGHLPAAGQRALPPWPGELRQLGNREIFVREAGSGDQPAVFVHGLGGSATNWTDLMALLGDIVSGYAPDLPGFGFSPAPKSGRYPLNLHARVVTDVLRQVGGGEPVHLFGNSLGGATSIRVAARHPELIRTLTLVSPALPDLRPRGGMDWRLPLLFLPGIGPLVQRRLSTAPAEDRVDRLMKLILAPGNELAAERLAEAADEVRRRDGLDWADSALVGSLRGLVAAQARPGRSSLWHDVRRIKAPTLLVWGRHDRLVDVRVSARAQRSFADATLLVLEDAGHVAQIERPETVAAAWRERFADTHTANS